MDTKRIQNWGNNYQEEPSESLWNRIDSKLDEVKPTRQSKLFTLSWKHYAIAANILLVIAVIIGFGDYFKNHNKHSFSYNINQKPVKMEELHIDEITSQYYSLENISTLSKAYKNSGF